MKRVIVTLIIGVSFLSIFSLIQPHLVYAEDCRSLPAYQTATFISNPFRAIAYSVAANYGNFTRGSNGHNIYFGYATDFNSYAFWSYPDQNSVALVYPCGFVGPAATFSFYVTGTFTLTSTCTMLPPDYQNYQCVYYEIAGNTTYIAALRTYAPLNNTRPPSTGQTNADAEMETFLINNSKPIITTAPIIYPENFRKQSGLVPLV